MKDRLYRDEWGVVQKINGDRPKLMPQSYLDRKDAESYREWLIDRDENVAIAAQKEEAANFPGGNQNFYIWHHGHENRALKNASYHLVTRSVSDWEEIDE